LESVNSYYDPKPRWSANPFARPLALLQAVGVVTIAILGDTAIAETPPARQPHQQLPSGRCDHSAALIDKHLQAAWTARGVTRSPQISDASFLRRVSLALNGIPPTAEEVIAFLDDNSDAKREAKVNELLSRSRYADYWAFRLRAWITTLREVKGQGTDLTTLYNYCREAMAENRGWDVIARDLLATQSNIAIDGRGNFAVYFDGEPNEFADAASRFFLGTNLACAQYHDHPYVDEWKQESYWGMAAFFARTETWDFNVVGAAKYEERFPEIGRSESSISTLPGGDAAIDGGGGENRAVADLDEGEIDLPNSTARGRIMPTPLGREPFVNPDTGDRSRRDQLVDWIVAAENPFFARAAVNRIFLEMTGRGFIDTVDGFSPNANANVQHEELLNRLATEFTSWDYDLKWLMRSVALSRMFQLEQGDESGMKSWHCALRRPLNSDQWHDSVLRATGEERRAYAWARQVEPLLIEERNARVQRRAQLIPAAAARLRQGKKFAFLADRLPSVDADPTLIDVPSDDKDRERLNQLRKQYADFGHRIRDSRASMSDTSSALLRMNGPLIASSLREGPAAQAISEETTPDARLDAAFLRVLGRYPTETERAALRPTVAEANRQSAANVMWVLMQTTEFQTY
jgi:hypothetical protein